MFGRNVSFLLLFLLCYSPLAQAKKWTFVTGSPFGVGLLTGVSAGPDTDLVVKPQTQNRSFSHFYGFEPFLDFGNFAIRLSGQVHYHPIVSGGGTSGGANFTETSDVTTLLYGGQLLLAPYISEGQTTRAFLKMGLSHAKAFGKNKRTFADGGPIYTEKFDGKTRELSFSGGLEFFLVQNYSLQLEGGFRQIEFEKLTYSGGTDLNGTTRTAGETMYKPDLTQKKLNYSGAYFAAGLNLNF